MNSAGDREARQYPRYAVHCRASAQVLSSSGLPSEVADAIHGEIQNISNGGFRLLLERPCEVSSLLRCEILLPGFPGAIPTLAQIRWVQGTAEGNYVAGVQFLLQ
jgi:hypothetical protein